MDKQKIRKELLNRRKQLLFDYKNNANDIIKEKVLTITKEIEHIGIYVSLKDEVDTLEIINTLIAQNKKVYVPKCSGNTLTFHQITSLDELVPSKYHLLEPINEPVNLNQIEIMFVPLVGFDQQYNRMGYGKGFYDSILNQIRCKKIGLAYIVQQVDLIPTEQHDVPLDDVITE